MSNQNHAEIRLPAVAGRFYPGTSNALLHEIDELFKLVNTYSELSTQIDEKPLALIVPHAGYVFSGEVAASAYQTLEGSPAPKTVFVIGCSHHQYFRGASIFSGSHYQTPLGTIQIDEAIQKELLSTDIISSHPEAHLNEHCIEVQLPFIQYLWDDNLSVVPILIGNQNENDCQQIAKALQPYFTKENLFIISTDLSHYPSYADAKTIDRQTIEAVLTGQPEKLAQQLKDNQGQHIKNLATSMCGWPAVYTLMLLCQPTSAYSFIDILYQNSGDNKLYGEHDRVVGYQSIALIERKPSTAQFTFNDEEQAELLHLARQAIQNHLNNGDKTPVAPKPPSNALDEECGAFVSVYIDNELRGCIGQMIGQSPLWQLVQEMAITASSNDTRFMPIRKDELHQLSIEISILSPLRKIDNPQEFIPGKHGIYIKQGYRTGTFLPQVADKTGWNRDEMLGHCARDKAGIGWNGWKNADLYIYEAFILKD